MKDKVESTDNIDDYDEDIPFPENWKRESLESMKNSICDWIDHNIEHEYQSYPNFFIKDEEKRFYMRIIEEGASDDAPEDDGYYCLVVPFDTKQVEEV